MHRQLPSKLLTPYWAYYDSCLIIKLGQDGISCTEAEKQYKDFSKLLELFNSHYPMSSDRLHAIRSPDIISCYDVWVLLLTVFTSVHDPNPLSPSTRTIHIGSVLLNHRSVGKVTGVVTRYFDAAIFIPSSSVEFIRPSETIVK